MTEQWVTTCSPYILFTDAQILLGGGGGVGTADPSVITESIQHVQKKTSLSKSPRIRCVCVHIQTKTP